MKTTRTFLLRLTEKNFFLELPERIILADAILMILIIALLIYTFFKVKSRKNSERVNKTEERFENETIEFENRDVLMQKQKKITQLEIDIPFSNISVRSAFFWLIVLMIILNYVYFILR